MKPILLLPFLVGAAIVLAATNVMNIFVLPLILMSLGFFVLGYALPPYVEKSVQYGYSIWMTIGFIIAGVIGFYLVTSSNTFVFLTTNSWCGLAPCFPGGMIFLGFAIGNFAFWTKEYLAGVKFDLLEGKK